MGILAREEAQLEGLGHAGSHDFGQDQPIDAEYTTSPAVEQSAGLLESWKSVPKPVQYVTYGAVAWWVWTTFFGSKKE